MFFGLIKKGVFISQVKKIELIYDDGCPNVDLTRNEIKKALEAIGSSQSWIEWDRNSDSSPDYARRYGSPTVLVNGKDVSGDGGTGDDNCCRVYSSDNGRLAGVPPAAMIAEAMNDSKNSSTTSRKGSLSRIASAVPASIVAIIPAFSCPGCWPFYIGLLSSMGIGAYDLTASLLPIMTVALAFSLGTLLYKASRRHGYRPFILGLVASILLLWGKIGLENNFMTYTGAVILIGASIWNALPVPAKKVGHGV